MFNFACSMPLLHSKTGLIRLLFSALVVSILLSACVNRKSSAYFQNENTGKVPEFNLTLRSGDLLSIAVTANDAELVVPFNQTSAIASGQAAGYSNGIASSGGYLIEADGTIAFPVLGRIILAGLSRAQATKMLEEKLTSYLQNPSVSIRILNFKITVLGDVRNPGTFTIPNERISFPEAIGLAGDLNITGKRANVLLVRTSSGTKQSFRIDLTQEEIFKSSDYFYLQQGDLIYVEPNRAQRNSSAINNRLGILISVASLILTSITLILK
jgi:polysaccharide export outer membrane protein